MVCNIICRQNARASSNRALIHNRRPDAIFELALGMDASDIARFMRILRSDSALEQPIVLGSARAALSD